MAYEIKFMSLQKLELEYEVAIRGENPGSTVQELRRQIAKCGPLYPSEDILTSPFDPANDLEGVVDTLEKVNNNLLISPPDRNTLLRTQNVLNHLYHRIRRIPCTSSNKQDYDQCVSIYKDYVTKLNKLLDIATDPLATSASNVANIDSTSPAPINVSVTCEGNNINLFSKLKFDGKSCVRAFIQRAQEFCLAKNIKSDKILKNTTEIFTGDALHWYRGIRDSVQTWDELVVLLKRDFSQPDYDYKLMTEIRSRTQGEKENIVIYLSIMSGLFSRLTKDPSEDDKLEIILHNIRPCYANTLSSVSAIKTIDELRTLCRNYENIESRLSQFKEPPKVTSETLAPEFAYSGSSSNKHSQYNTHKFSQFKSNRNANENINKVYYNKQNFVKNSDNNYKLNAVSSSNKQKPYCIRCRSNSHSTRQCKEDRTNIFCFVCGLKDFKSNNCPNCTKNKQSEPKN